MHRLKRANYADMIDSLVITEDGDFETQYFNASEGTDGFFTNDEYYELTGIRREDV